MMTSICPDREDLRSFHLGLLDERREQEVLDHLNDCQSCEDTVASLEGTADSLMVAVRSSAASASNNNSDRPALQRALSDIENLIDPSIDHAKSSRRRPESEPPVSERIRDYELLGTLGEGGMGTVYRARHTRLDRQVALKLLPARRLRDQAAVVRFEREMKAIGRLDHPTIVRATDAGDVDGTHFLAMDYVEGIDLSKLVRLVGPLDIASACEIVRQAAIGLDYAHQQELIHRDVKPSNLMLTLHGDVRILDLGLALFGAASEALDELTTVGQLMGTLDYMAPEQGDNSHDVDARADVYSLGATLFKLLTGTAPYDAPNCRTPLAKMKALATIDAPSVAERRPDLPGELIAIIDRTLARNVQDRFTTAKDLADALLPFGEGHVLHDLAECGRNLATQEDRQISSPPTLPPFIQRADMPAADSNVRGMSHSRSGSPGRGRKLAKWMIVPLILLAGVVIWIRTDNGTLIVESSEPDLPIEIRSGGEFHSSETLSVGKNELTIRSGTYEIVLPKEYDSLKVENNVFTLERSGKWLAKISKRDRAETEDTGIATTPLAMQGLPGIPPATSGVPLVGGPEPSMLIRNSGPLVFSGRTFEEWHQAVMTERNPSELEKAVQALCILGRNNRDAEAAATVLAVVDGYLCNPIGISSEASLVASAIRYLRSLDPARIEPEVVTAVRNGGLNSRTLILKYLASETSYASSGNRGRVSLGNGQPLSDYLASSEAFNNALRSVFHELHGENRHLAFEAITGSLDSERPAPELVDFLRECSFSEIKDTVSLKAARKLAEIKPSSALASVFLDRLENSGETLAQMVKQQGNQFGQSQQDWFTPEQDAWFGLAALGRHAADSVDRVNRLASNIPASMAAPQVVYFMDSDQHVREVVIVHRQLLALEILALIGPAAESAVPTINKVLHNLTGYQPSVQALYGFESGRPQLLLERMPEQSWQVASPRAGVSIPASIRNIPESAERLNSAILAIHRITGELPRFEVTEIGYDGGPNRHNSFAGDSGMPGSSMASEAYSDMYGASKEGEYGFGGDSQKPDWLPRLVTYKGKSFTEWTDPRNTTPDMPLSDLRDMFRGASLLAKNRDEKKTAAAIANGAFQYAARQSWKLTPELRDFLVDTIEASYSYDPSGVLTPIEDVLAQVAPERQAFLLNELLLPVEESEFGFRLQQRSFSRYVVSNPQFSNAYNDLVTNWDKQPAELQEAIIQAESSLPSLGQKNSVQLLTRLVKEAYDSARSDAKTAGTMTDIQMKAAFILAATEPKNAEVQQQLDGLLSGVLTKPHVFQLNARAQGDDAGVNGASGREEVKTPPLHDFDADRLHAAIALKLASGDSLSEATARRFAQQIIQDTERGEIETFGINSPVSNRPRAGFHPGFGQVRSVGGVEMSAFAPASTPGMSSYPGSGSGATGMPGGYPGGITDLNSGGGPGQSPGKSDGADFGELSRRVLMIQLLLKRPPSDPAVQNEIGEQLAQSLLKIYPQTFLPSSEALRPTASIYDLVEQEFRSGVRYKERPAGQGTLEIVRFVDTASAVVWNYLPQDRRMQLRQTRMAELQTAENASKQPQKLYDGRPFEEWLHVVTTERSPERLVEAVQALTILGKSGRDVEAATAILSCVASFSPDRRLSKTPEGRLIDTIHERFWQLDRTALTPVLVDTILRGNSNQRQFILILNESRLRSMLKPDGSLMKAQFISVLLEATSDADPGVRQSSTALMAPLLLGTAVSLPAAELSRVKSRLTQLLDDEQANLPAAVCLSQLAPETEGLPKILLSGVEEFMANETGRSLQITDPYWALRKLIVQSRQMQDELTPQLQKLLEQPRQKPPAHVYEVDYYRFDHQCLVAELLVAGAKRPDAATENIRGSLADLYSAAARLPKSASERAATAGSQKSDASQYTPVLKDNYEFPLPTEYRRQRAPNGGQEDADITAAAAAWALQQLPASEAPE